MRQRGRNAHQPARETVGGESQDEFVVQHVHRLTFEGIHLQSRFYMPQVQYDFPWFAAYGHHSSQPKGLPAG